MLVKFIAFIHLLIGQACSALAVFCEQASLRIAERLVAANPSNSKFLQFQKDARHSLAQTQLTQAQVEDDIDRLKDS